MSRLGFVVAALVAFSSTAWAQEDPQPPQEDYQDYLGLGSKNLKVRGKIGAQFWTDDNVSLVKNNEIDDFITVIVPELNVRFDHGNDFVTLDYRGRDMHYNENRDFNGMEHYIDGKVHFRLDKFFLEITDSYANRIEPFNAVLLSDRLMSIQNDARVMVGADFDKFDIEVSAGVRRFELHDSIFDLLDHRRIDVSGTGLFDIMPKTQALIEYGYTTTEFDEDDVEDNFVTHRVVAGIRGSPTAKLRTTAKAGFVQVIMDDTGVIVTDDRTDLYLGISADWDVTASGILNVEILRQPVESIFGSAAISMRFAIKYKHDFTERINANLGGYYETISEVESGEDRMGYGINGGLGYKVGRHLNLDLWGEWRAKRSDDDNFEYDNIRGYFGARIDF